MAMLCLTSGCATTRPSCPAMMPSDDGVVLLSRGWHTEIGIQASRLRGDLAVFRRIFPGARTVMFGYGKRTFMTARTDRASEYLLGPFPGPAVIEVVGLSSSVRAAYGGQDAMTLRLPPGGDAALSAFIWHDLVSSDGMPRFVGPGRFRGSLFYAARSAYTLGHDCNGWTIEALHAAGLPVSPAGVVFSGQAMGRASALCAAE